MADEHTLLLGEIKGKLDLVIANQTAQGEKLDQVDARLRRVETKAAMNGAVSGGIVSVGIALMLEGAKRKMGI